jgi:FlgD Ig-like domain
MRAVRALLLAAGIGVMHQAPLYAQADDLVARAVRAYGDVELAAAVGYLRRWLASDAAAHAPRDTVELALTYLGAAEVLRGYPDSADTPFERLIELDPRGQVDQLIFPPAVTGRFAAVRARTKVVAVDVAPVTELHPGGAPLTARLYASSPHQLRVVLRRAAGGVVRTLYVGIIGDSLSVSWDGRDSSGSWVASGSYFLEAFSALAAVPPQRMVQLPLEVAMRAPDTLPAPPPFPDSLLQPERRGAGPGMEALLGGLVAGAGVVVLPSLLAPDSKTPPLRFAVAGTVGLAGLIGFVRDLPGGTVERNRRANAARRQAWEEQARAVDRQNRDRQAGATMTIRAGEPTLVRLAGP